MYQLGLAVQQYPPGVDPQSGPNSRRAQPLQQAQQAQQAQQLQHPQHFDQQSYEAGLRESFALKLDHFGFQLDHLSRAVSSCARNPPSPRASATTGSNAGASAHGGVRQQDQQTTCQPYGMGKGHHVAAQLEASQQHLRNKWTVRNLVSTYFERAQRDVFKVAPTEWGNENGPSFRTILSEGQASTQWPLQGHIRGHPQDHAQAHMQGPPHGQFQGQRQGPPLSQMQCLQQGQLQGQMQGQLQGQLPHGVRGAAKPRPPRPSPLQQHRS